MTPENISLLVWSKISDAGIHDELSFHDKSRIRITNQMAFIVAILSIGYFLFDYFFAATSRNRPEQLAFYILHFGAIVQYIFVLVLNKKQFYVTARIGSILIYCGILLFNSMSLGKPFHSELYFFSLAAFVFVVFNNFKIIFPIYLLILSGYIASSFYILKHSNELDSINAGLIIREFISFFMLFLILYFLRKENTNYQNEIEIKNAQLSDDRDQIQKINFTKDKIFSIISHDLRSPIGALHALLGFIKQDQLSIGEFKKATGTLEKQVKQLQTSLDELLTWSKAQLNGINPDPELVPLKQLVYEVVTICRLSSRDKRIIITTKFISDPEVFCDVSMLKSVITNLIMNAIKFTPAGGAISITCQRIGEHVQLDVEDTGVGIPEENLQKILIPNEHFTTRGTNNEKGTGLGLIMCREFIEKNHGKLVIKSKEGKGAVFSVQLPGNSNY